MHGRGRGGEGGSPSGIQLRPFEFINTRFQGRFTNQVVHLDPSASSLIHEIMWDGMRDGLSLLPSNLRLAYSTTTTKVINFSFDNRGFFCYYICSVGKIGTDAYSSIIIRRLPFYYQHILIVGLRRLAALHLRKLTGHQAPASRRGRGIVSHCLNFTLE
jgi:hypothetical protein